MQFWYYLNGPDGSTGRLSMAKHDRNGTEQTLWSGGIYDQGWRYEQAAVSGGVDPFTMIFQAFKSSNDVVVAIDDVTMTLGFCPSPINCDFESFGLCSWTQMQDDQLDWLHHSGETLSFGTGPLVGKNGIRNEDCILEFDFVLLDHTTNSPDGHYIFIESSAPAKPNDTARIISEHLVIGQGCFSLWYHMFGPDIGSLIIYTQTKTGPMVKVNEIIGEQGNQWMKLSTDIAITLQSTDYLRIVVEAVVGKEFLGKREKIFCFFDRSFSAIHLGDIAVDDITWLPGLTCASGNTTTTSTTPTTPTTYRKRNSRRK